MPTDKANAICLLDILKEYSDEQHILPMREILSKLQIIYGIKPDRRTIYGAVALLIDLGYDISTYEENGIGYFLRSRDIESSEVLLLMDAVYSFPFIPAKQSEHLIAKLQKLLSIHQRKRYQHLTVVRPDRKTDNRQVFWNIEKLDEAISAKQQVRFKYLQYGSDKKLHPRSDKLYTVNPYGMVYLNEHYYLVCNHCYYPDTSLYRIDRISDIQQLSLPWDKHPDSENAIRDAVYAFSGPPEKVTIRFEKGILNDVIDKFGTGIRISRTNDEQYTAELTVPPHGMKFWALQYLPYAEVVQPQWLRDEIIESIHRNPYTNIKTGGSF